MSDAVAWTLQLKIQEGRYDDTRALMDEMVEATKEEKGTIGYEWYISGDNTVCHIHERFVDSSAAMVHLGNFGSTFAPRFMECFQPTGFHVYGDPSEEVRGALKGLGASVLGWFGGFSR